jgi:hypothetical protein
MDLYLAHARRTRAPIGLVVMAVIGMIIWAFTAQGRAAAANADGPSETAHKLDSYVAVSVEDDDDLDDFDANGRDDSGSGSGGGGSDSGGDSSGDGKSGGSSHGGTSGGGGGGSDSGGDSSGDGGSSGSSHGGTSGGNPPTEEPPTEEPPTEEPPTEEPPTEEPPTEEPPNEEPPNNPPGGGVLPGSGGPTVPTLPDTAMAVDGSFGGLIAGLLTLAAASGSAVRARVTGATRRTR